MRQKIFLLLTLGSLAALSFRRDETPSSDFYDFIAQFDLSNLWLPGKIVTGATTDTLRPEALGFIDTTFDRFQIHFMNVVKSPESPYQYLVFGKTKAYGKVKNFKGTLTVKEARMYDESLDPKLRQGFVRGIYELGEAEKNKPAGKLSGHFVSRFVWKGNYEVGYDALASGKDSFCNNQFEGVWQENAQTKKCNWGDFRVPGSKGLDIGKHRFEVSSKYLNHGWATYKRAHEQEGTSPERLKAIAVENTAWWE